MVYKALVVHDLNPLAAREVFNPTVYRFVIFVFRVDNFEVGRNIV